MPVKLLKPNTGCIDCTSPCLFQMNTDLTLCKAAAHGLKHGTPRRAAAASDNVHRLGVL